MRGAIAAGNASPAVGEAFRVVEFSVQNDHVHMIVEAQDGEALSRGMQGLAIRLARAINRRLKARGNVWADRFHARDLKTPRAVRNAIVYVLMNAKKHGAALRGRVDAFSSSPWFEGFRDASPAITPRPNARARTWLGKTGWRRRGLIALAEAPRAPD